MKLTQVKGSTWVLEANELIPLYLLDDRRCVLLDSGLAKEREEIEKTLLEAGLEPAGILCSHAHVDHCANNRYFQEKYHLPVALTAPEAGMCSSILNLKCYRLLVSPDAAEQEMSEMVHVPDLILPPVDGPIRLAGAMFRILHTPGHSPGHMCFWEPERGYLFAGDLVYLGTLFAYYPSTNPIAYLASLETVAALPVKRVFPGHHSLGIQPEILIRMRDAFRSLCDAGMLRHGSGTFDYGDWAVWL